jgi:hypothetical protein
MPDHDEHARALAAEMMIEAARSISKSDVKYVIGGHEDLADLSDAAYDAWLDQVVELIETADIDINIQGA